MSGDNMTYFYMPSQDPSVDYSLVVTKTSITASPALANWNQNDIYADDYI